MLKVVGAGVGRTGTHSLKAALETLLGGTSHHMIEVFAHPEEVPIWIDAIDGNEVHWGQLMEPTSPRSTGRERASGGNSRTSTPTRRDPLVRDPDEWYTSCSNTIFAGMHGMIENGDAWMAALLRLFGDRFSDQIADRDANDRGVRKAQCRGACRCAQGAFARVDGLRRLGAHLRTAWRSGSGRTLPGDEHHGRVPGDDRPAARGRLSPSQPTRRASGSLEWAARSGAPMASSVASATPSHVP